MTLTTSCTSQAGLEYISLHSSKKMLICK